MNPPLLPTTALSAEESQLQSAAVMFSQQRDVVWLSQVHGNDKPAGQVGQVSMLSKIDWRQALPPKTLVVFGPMIDSPPAPDTVITTLMYIQRTLKIVLGCSTPTSQSTSNCIRLHA